VHTAGNIKSTAFKLPLSVLDQARQIFAQHMSSIFPAGAPVDSPASNVIQDVNIRLFYDGVAEAMGCRYEDLVLHAIVLSIPFTNSVSIMWLSDTAIFAQGVFATSSLATIAARLGIINVREAPISIALGDCESSARFCHNPAYNISYLTAIQKASYRPEILLF
jgi:hypothetical protein